MSFIQGREIAIIDLSKLKDNKKVIQRNSKLCSLAINQDCSIIACGDDFGKIYLLHNFLQDGAKHKLVI